MAKYCSAPCRKKAARQRAAQASSAMLASQEPALVAAVRRELAAANAEDSVDGQLALCLAEQVAVGTGAALAKLVDELRRARADALAPARGREGSGEAGQGREDEVSRARRLHREARRAAGLPEISDDAVTRARRRRDEVAARAAAEAPSPGNDPEPAP